MPQHAPRPCPHCGKLASPGMVVCRSCGGSLRRSIWRRLADWFPFRINIRIGIDPQSGATLGLSHGRSTIELLDKSGKTVKAFASLDELPPELRKQVEAARGEGQVFEYKEVMHIDPDGTRTYEQGQPPSPELHATLKQLMGDGSSSRQRFVFKDQNGQEHVYESLEQMPPEVRAMFEDISRDLPK